MKIKASFYQKHNIAFPTLNTKDKYVYICDKCGGEIVIPREYLEQFPVGESVEIQCSKRCGNALHLDILEIQDQGK